MPGAPNTFDRRVLDQDRFWVTADATILRISEMSPEHLAAALAFLHERHATRLHMEAMLDVLVEFLDPHGSPGPNAESITHELTGESIVTVDQHAWLETTPLVRAMRRELASRP